MTLKQLLIGVIFAASLQTAMGASFKLGNILGEHATSNLFDNTMVTMSGEITRGDAQRLIDLFASQTDFPSLLELHSKGGDVGEALRIASVVDALYLKVSVDRDAICASSCFLIYIAGFSRGAEGRIGIHRPYLRQPGQGPASAQLQEARMKQMREYLTDKGVSGSLIDKMMSHPSNDIYWLSRAEVRALGRYSAGLEEQLISRCGYSRSSNGSDYSVWGCISRYEDDFYAPLRQAALDRMRKGWKPWN